MSMREELIEIYSETKVVEIEESKSFQELCKKYQNAEGFEPERLRIHFFKKELEEYCREQTNKSQIRLCLKLLSREKDQENRLAYHDLIIKAYWIYWSDAQKKHFDKAFTILNGDVYFFLSFTNCNSTPEYASKVNRENRFFLEDIFYPDKIFETGAPSQNNLLAKAIHHYLQGQGIQGFYYPEHEGESNNVKIKLQKYCHKALTFLQLIQGTMFEYKTPNFCHFEYEEALKSEVCCKRIYVMGEERNDILARRNTIFGGWLNWFDEALNDVDALQLIPTRYRDDSAVKKNHEAVKNKIVRQIETIRDNLFAEIPE